MRYPYRWEFVAPKVAYLVDSDIVNFNHPTVQDLVNTFKMRYKERNVYAKEVFHYVRDEIFHTGDYGKGDTTLRASEVIEKGTGWCYAKSHLLVALLRANYIPAGFGYQRLSVEGGCKAPFSLHGFAFMFLKGYGWFAVDPRGNNAEVHVAFEPPYSNLAFPLTCDEEKTFIYCFDQPLREVVDALQTNPSFEQMCENFPDKEEIDTLHL